MDVLEYIHEKGYVHADIKGSNILLSATSKSQVYLVDFGLATHYSNDKAFKPNPKKAHNGTIEYLSRDAHQGVETRRGDLEILAYNLIQWLGGSLPWETNLTDPKIVQQSKEQHMSNIKNFLKVCFEAPPSPIENLLKYINTLKFNDSPDYKKVHSFLMAGLKEVGGTLGKPLLFENKKTPDKRKKAAASVTESPPSPPKQARKGRKKLVEVEEEKTNSSTEENKKPAVKKAQEASLQNGKDKYNGYTPAMLEIAQKKEKQNKRDKKVKDPEPSTSSGMTDAKRALRVQQPVVYYGSSEDLPDRTIKKRKT